jgi:mono/diheme cytochrome c family protein
MLPPCATRPTARKPPARSRDGRSGRQSWAAVARRPCRIGLRPLIIAAAALVATPGMTSSPARADAVAVLRDRCAGCHTDGGAEGGLDLDTLLTDFAAGRPPPTAPAHRSWVAIWHNVRAGTMPPADEPQPTPVERDAVLAFVQRDVFALDPARPDPGHVVLRRLNRAEYARTVRDLVGVSFDAVEAFPADDTGYGFDTIGAVLSVSPLLMEKYLEAARTIAVSAVAPARAAKRGPDGRLAYPSQTRAVFFEGPPPDDPAGHEAALRRLFDRLATRAFRRPVDGPTLDAVVRLASDAAERQTAEAPASGDDDVREAARRRFEDAVEIGITALLGGPRFVFRVESPDPDATAAPAGAGVPIDEFSLATRLSYFLWGTMPDETLFALASSGTLRANLDAQVDRMIDDPRADAFVAAFVGQWLQVRDIETMAFDARRILGLKDSGAAAKVFSDAVRRGLRRETEMLFAHVLREGLPATDLLVAPYTFLDGPLAQFYGLEDLVEGDGKSMRLVSLPPGSHRGGLLTHGSVLAVTSNPTRTSPVKRGLFVLENLLGTPAPPAPADVPSLGQAAAAAEGKKATMRELMAIHREAPLCASCHARMDPLGLALESYDALGRYRDTDDGQPIETAGTLITGESFADVQELAARIATERRADFHRCLAEKMLTFASGRGMEYFDTPTVDTMERKLADNGSLRVLVHEVVRSVPFQRMRVSADRPEQEDRP